VPPVKAAGLFYQSVARTLDPIFARTERPLSCCTPRGTLVDYRLRVRT